MRRIVCLGLLAGAAGCSSSEKEPNASQVVATVNGKELTSTQLENRFGDLPPSLDRRDPAVQRQVLKSFIDEILVSQEALKDKLDKNPSVARELDKVRNIVLARAFVAKMAPAGRASEAEVNRFYYDKPFLFSERRRYKLSDVAVDGSRADLTKYIALLQSAGFDPLVAALRADKLRIVATNPTVGAEQLPEPLAKGLASRAAGDSVHYQSGKVHHFIRIDSVESAPASLDTSRAAIGNYIDMQRRSKVVQTELDQLRQSAKITYGDVGNNIMKAQVATTKTRDAAAPSTGSISRGAAAF